MEERKNTSSRQPTTSSECPKNPDKNSISYEVIHIKADTLDNLSISEITSIHIYMQINYPNLQLVIYIYIK